MQTLITRTANYLNFHQIAGCGNCGIPSDQKPSTPRHPYNMNLWNIRNNPTSCFSYPASSLSSFACSGGQSRLCIYGRCSFMCEIPCVSFFSWGFSICVIVLRNSWWFGCDSLFACQTAAVTVWWSGILIIHLGLLYLSYYVADLTLYLQSLSILIMDLN